MTMLELNSKLSKFNDLVKFESDIAHAKEKKQECVDLITKTQKRVAKATRFYIFYAC